MSGPRNSPAPGRGCGPLAGLALLLALGACGPPAMPEVMISGSAAGVVDFEDWKPVRVGGKVVKWQATLVRRRNQPIGAMDYTLVDEAGEPLSAGSLDYRRSYLYDGQPFERGDRLPISIAAYRGDAYGNQVARIEIQVHGP